MARPQSLSPAPWLAAGLGLLCVLAPRPSARAAPASPPHGTGCQEAGRRFGQAMLAADPRQEDAARRMLEAALAHAERQAPRAEATARCRLFLVQALWHGAQRHERARRYPACQAAYAALARRFPTTSRADIFHWNGFICAQRAGDGTAAEGLLTALVTRYPRSRLRAEAMLRLAEAHREVARFREAAAWHARFAAAYPKRKEAPDALHTAALLRAGLGDRSGVRAAVLAFARRYGPRRPRQSAALAWLLVELAERHGGLAERQRETEGWLRGHGRRAPPDQVMEAHRRLGALQWQRSCPTIPVDGLCVRVGRPGQPRRLLGRRPALIRAARTQARAILRRWDAWRRVATAGGWTARPAAAQRVLAAAAWAQFLLAELPLEAYLARALPGGLPLAAAKPAVRAAAARRLQSALQPLLREATTLRRGYARVLQRIRLPQAEAFVGDPTWSIAAVARQALVITSLVDRLRALQPRRTSAPRARRSTGTPAGTRAVPLEGLVGPLTARALAGLDQCRYLAEALRWYGPWAQHCQRECQRLAPRRCPRTAERYSTGPWTGLGLAPAGFRVAPPPRRRIAPP